MGTRLTMDKEHQKFLIVEPFYGGSHKQLADSLQQEFGGDLYSLPARKWHWRTRASALHFAQTIQQRDTYRTIFASSVLNLCELVSLRPDLGKLYKVLYFHENQLIYPVRKQKERDFQHGYNQILSCLVANVVLFNSHYNMESFLSSVDSYLNIIPDYKPQGTADKIRPKCSVLYFPLHFPFGHHEVDSTLDSTAPVHVSQCETAEANAFMNSTELTHATETRDEKKLLCQDLTIIVRDTFLHKSEPKRPLHILWPHRWEHDKGPDALCNVLLKMVDENLDFVISILGEHTADIPECFKPLFTKLGSSLLHKDYVPREVYWQVLRSADVVISTAKHEFYGVSMLEAVFCGCYPLCPNRLVYPEIYPQECLYNTEQQLFRRLEHFCQCPHSARVPGIKEKVNISQFLWTSLKDQYGHHLLI